MANTDFHIRLSLDDDGHTTRIVQAYAYATSHGKTVASVERADLSGAGINPGTLPSKPLRETVRYYSGLRQRGLYGIDNSLREGLTVQDFMFRKQQVVEKRCKLITRNLVRRTIDLTWGRHP